MMTHNIFSPPAALFFVTYEKVKSFTRTVVPPSYLFTTHMAAASFGELVRVKVYLLSLPLSVNVDLIF